VGHVKDAFDENGNLVDSDSVLRLHGLVDSVMNAAELLRSTNE